MVASSGTKQSTYVRCTPVNTGVSCWNTTVSGLADDSPDDWVTFLLSTHWSISVIFNTVTLNKQWNGCINIDSLEVNFAICQLTRSVYPYFSPPLLDVMGLGLLGTDFGPQSPTVCLFLLSDFLLSVAAPFLSQEGVPRRQPHRRSGLATLPSVGAVPQSPHIIVD